MTTTRYIATDEQTTAIYGIGDSHEAAAADANAQAPQDEPREWTTYPASEALYRHVERNGGGPDVRWTRDDDVAVLESDESIQDLHNIARGLGAPIKVEEWRGRITIGYVDGSEDDYPTIAEAAHALRAMVEDA